MSNRLPLIVASLVIAGGLLRAGPVTVITSPGASFAVDDSTPGDQITISDGPVVSGFSTISITDSTGTVEFANQIKVSVDDLGGGDTFLFDVSTASTGLTSFTMNGGSGADNFTVSPLSGILITVNGGGNPRPAPGNVLTVDLAGTTSAILSDTDTADGFQGSWTTDLGTVDFTGIETVTTPKPGAPTMVASPRPSAR